MSWLAFMPLYLDFCRMCGDVRFSGTPHDVRVLPIVRFAMRTVHYTSLRNARHGLRIN